MTNYDELSAAVESCRVDYDKAIKGNKASSTRVRKVMLKIRELVMNIRKEMLEARPK